MLPGAPSEHRPARRGTTLRFERPAPRPADRASDDVRAPRRGRRALRWLRRLALAVAVAAVATVLFDRLTRIVPPPLAAPAAEELAFDAQGVAHVGDSTLERRNALWILHVRGGAE